MAQNISTIANFKACAIEEWAWLFGGECLSKDEWDKRQRARHGLHEPTDFERRMSANAEYATYETHIFLLKNPIEFYVVEEGLRNNPMTTRLYYVQVDLHERSGKKAGFIFDTTRGMYLILISSNSDGKVSEIYVEVYNSFEEFTASITSYWTEMNDDVYYNIHKCIDVIELTNLLATI